jgi:hypothetical protein
MPTIYKRNCDRCKNFYVGEGRMYCSRFCADKSNGEKIRGENHPMWGKKHKKSSLEKMSEKTRGENNPMFGLRGNKHPAFGKHWKVFGRIGKKGKDNPLWGRKQGKHQCIVMSRKHAGKKNPMFGRKGELAPNWRGGTTPLKKIIRNSPQYIVWRDKVFKRDKWKCQKCSKVGGKLHVHHIKTFSLILKEEKIKCFTDILPGSELWNVKNGYTMCVLCHKNTESYGWKSYNIEKGYKITEKC